MEEKLDDKGLNLFGKNYKEDDLTTKQKSLINHISDIDRKLRQAKFDADQYGFCKLSFLKALEDDLNDSKKDKEEKDSTKEK